MGLNINVLINEKGAELIGKLKKDVLSLDSVLAKAGAAMGAYFAFNKLKSFVTESINASDAQEQALKKLEVSLGYTSTALINQASALQQNTIVGNETITGMQALLATYKLSEEEILKLTPAILDMAQATGTDLDSAANKVAKSIVSKTNALQRDGIEIDATADKSTKLNQVLAVLEDRYKGQAQAAASVGLGGLIQLKNLYGDLQENIGKLITSSGIFQTVLTGLGWITIKLTSATASLREEYQVTEEDLLDVEVQAYNLTEALAKVIPVTAGMGVALSEYNRGAFGSAQGIEDAMASIKTVTAAAEATIVNFSATQEKIEAKNRAIESRRKAEAERKLSEAKRLAKEKAALDELLYKSGGELEEVVDNNAFDFVKEEKDNNIARLNEISSFLDQRIALEDSYVKKQQDMHVAATSTKLDDLALEYAREIEIAEQLGADKTLINEMYLENYKRIKAEETAAAEFAAIRQSAMAYQMAGDVAGALAELNDATKGSAKVTQGLLALQAVMNMASGIMAIWGNPNPLVTFPQRLVQTGILGAIGTAQVIKIRSQKLADGGWVQGTGSSRSDNVPTMLSPRERVLSVREIERNGGQNAIDRAINAGTAGGGGISISVAGNIIAPNEWLRDELLPAIERERSR